MSDTQEAAPAPKKQGKLKKWLLLGVGATVLLGGGAAAGIYASGYGLGHAGPAEDPNRPKLVLRDGKETAGAPHEAPPADPARYKARYYTLEQPFTSNMRDTDGIMQVGLGVSTFYDSRVIDAMKDNEIPVRSAILMTLADQDSFVVATPEGKKALQKQLTDAINGVLRARTGYGGIDNVYFTTFIIQ